jgi:hypothetical protein
MTQSLTKLYALLNEDQSPVPPFSPTNVALENPQPASGVGYNSQVTLRGLEGQAYEGTAVAKYRRLDLALLLSGLATQTLPATPQALLDQINTLSGAWLDLEDLETFVLPDPSPGVVVALVLTTKPTSYAFTGQATLQVKSAVEDPVVDVEDGTVEPDPSAFLFRDTYETGSGPILGRTPEAGTYNFEYYNETNNLAPVLDAGWLEVAPGMQGFGLDGAFTPVAPSSGVLSLKTRLTHYSANAIIPELSYFDLGLTTDDGSYASASYSTGGGMLFLSNSFTNASIDAAWPVPADLTQPTEFELRWDTTTGDVGVYQDGTLLHSLAGAGPTVGNVNTFYVYGGDMAAVRLDSVEIALGAATPTATPVVEPAALLPYAHGGVAPEGYWFQSQRRTFMSNAETFVNGYIAAKVDAPIESTVVWQSEWTPAPTNTGPAPGFLPNRGPTTFPTGEIVTDPVFDYPLAACVDAGATQGESVGVMRVWAIVDGVPAANYFIVGFGYQEPNGQTFRDTPWVEGQFTTVFVDVGYAEPRGTAAPTVLIRDDFNGEVNSDFVGRVPNISVDGHAYSSLSDGSNAKFVLDGAGSAYTTVGTQEAAYGFLAYDEGTNLRVELSLRNADGVSALASNFDAIFSVEVHSAGQPARQADFGIDTVGSLYMYSAQAGDGSVAYAQPLGAGGAAVKFTFEWGNGHQKFFIDDVLQSDLVITAAGEPLGAGTLYLQLEPGNKIDYLQLSQLP